MGPTGWDYPGENLLLKLFTVSSFFMNIFEMDGSKSIRPKNLIFL
jgi:hypothetical protein